MAKFRITFNALRESLREMLLHEADPKKIDPEKLRLFKKLKVDKWSGGRPSGYDSETFSNEKQTRIVPKDSDPNFVKGREPTVPKATVEIDDEQRTVSHEEMLEKRKNRKRLEDLTKVFSLDDILKKNKAGTISDDELNIIHDILRKKEKEKEIQTILNKKDADIKHTKEDEAKVRAIKAKNPKEWSAEEKAWYDKNWHLFPKEKVSAPKVSQEDIARFNELSSSDPSEWSSDDIEWFKGFKRQTSNWVDSPDRDKTYLDALSATARAPSEEERLVNIYKERKPAAPETSGGVHVLKQRPASPPITKDYVGPSRQAPLLKKKQKVEVPRDVLKQTSPKAFASIPKGEWKVFKRGPYFVLEPEDPVKRMLVWTGVPGTDKEPEKPRAWRTPDEMKGFQREQLGFLDAHDKGKEGRDSAVGGEKPRLSPMNQADVRFKGGAGGGFIDVDTSGQIGGGVEDGLPSDYALNKLRNIELAGEAGVPDFRAMDLEELERSFRMAMNSYRDHNDTSWKKIADEIKIVIDARKRGVKAEKPITVKLPRKLQRNDVRDVIRAYEAKKSDDAEEYLSLLPDDIRVETENFLDYLAAQKLKKKSELE